MEKNIELNNSELNDETIDKDMEKILEALHQIPQVEIPDRLEVRLSNALKAEGRRIREERLLRTAKIKRNRYFKAAAVAAACFVVVFASLSMYNDGIGLFSDDNTSEESPADEVMLAAGDFDAAAREADPYGTPDATFKEEAESENSGLAGDGHVLTDGLTSTLSSEAPRVQSNDNGRDSENEEIYLGIQSTEPDLLCREGSQYIKATEEYLAYRKLVDEYLSGYEYELTDCERDSVTGAYLFNILILADPEGQIVNEPLILRGEQGEIYEQPEQQSTDDEPIEEQPAEYETEGE
ncbi:MAG: hypothetical protein ACOX4J_03255 [Anaerovoracaceae bacterium]|jgi:hypothetical protein